MMIELLSSRGTIFEEKFVKIRKWEKISEKMHENGKPMKYLKIDTR